MDDSTGIRRGNSAEKGQLIRLRQATPVRAGAELSTGDLFAILWSALADVLGTAAAAALLRRAARRAVLSWPELAALSITREDLEYCYVLPATWQDPALGRPGALCALAAELWPLLRDLTGSVIVARLAQIPELQSRGVVPA